MTKQLILHFDMDSVYKDKLEAISPSRSDDDDNSTIASADTRNYQNFNEDEKDDSNNNTGSTRATEQRKTHPQEGADQNLEHICPCTSEIQTVRATRKRARAEYADSCSNVERTSFHQTCGNKMGKVSLKPTVSCEGTPGEWKKPTRYGCFEDMQSCGEIDAECEANQGNWVSD